MEEAPVNSMESSHSVHANRMNETRIIGITSGICCHTKQRT